MLVALDELDASHLSNNFPLQRQLCELGGRCLGSRHHHPAAEQGRKPVRHGKRWHAAGWSVCMSAEFKSQKLQAGRKRDLLHRTL